MQKNYKYFDKNKFYSCLNFVQSKKHTEMIQNRTTTRFAVLMLMESRPFWSIFGPFWSKKTIQVCISLPILYRALGDPCDLLLTTLANKLCNYLINPIVYHSHLYGNLESGPSKMAYFSPLVVVILWLW